MTSTEVVAVASNTNTNTPCAACKAQRRKCTSDCVFAPYFPPDNPQKFNSVHKVFGASNVSKILMELPPENRGDAVNSMAYEADARLRNPVYGCVGLISVLQQRLRKLQSDLTIAKSDLSNYIGPSAMLPYFPPLPAGHSDPPAPNPRPHGLHLHQQQQQMIADEQYAAVREQEEMSRIGLEQHMFHQQAVMMRSSSSSINDGLIHNQSIFDSTGTFGIANSYPMNPQQQFNQQIQIQEQFMLQSQAPQPQPQQQYQQSVGILRELEDVEKSSNLLGHVDDDDGPSTYC